MARARRFLIIDDHPLVRDALTMRLTGLLGDVDIVYSGPSLADAIAASAREPADCAILDLDLGDGRSPILNTADLVEAGCPVLIVSALADGPTVKACLSAGALGYVSKQAPNDELLGCVTATLEGELSTSRDVAGILCDEESPAVALSEREQMAMVLYASGLTIDAVARRMGVKPSSAQEYIKRVRVKYSRAGTPLRTKTEIYRRARDEGLVS